MHDSKKYYCIVYDRADDDLDEAAKKHGTTLLMAPWEDVREGKPWGLEEPVLVSQFVAVSWERAMQHWYDLRGHGTYWIRCRNPQHEGDPAVRWVDDDYNCRLCVVVTAAREALNPLLGKPISPQTLEAAKLHILTSVREMQQSGHISSFTVSSERGVSDNFVKVFVKDAEGAHYTFTFRP